MKNAHKGGKLIFVAVLFFSLFAKAQQETTTYYFIRHAEKDRSDSSNRNPHLTEQGLNRAQDWSTILRDVQLEAVYSTDYNRTKETAQPTAESHTLNVQMYNPRELYDATFVKATNGKTVLVVGHSNTTPSFVNKVLGEKKYEAIDDSNNGNLYIVTIIGDKKSVQLLHFN